jgi:hypothetical protein
MSQHCHCPSPLLSQVDALQSSSVHTSPNPGQVLFTHTQAKMRPAQQALCPCGTWAGSFLNHILLALHQLQVLCAVQSPGHLTPPFLLQEI